MTHKSDNMAQSMKDKRGEAMEYDKNVIDVCRTPSEREQKKPRQSWYYCSNVDCFNNSIFILS